MHKHVQLMIRVMYMLVNVGTSHGKCALTYMYMYVLVLL